MLSRQQGDVVGGRAHSFQETKYAPQAMRDPTLGAMHPGLLLCGTSRHAHRSREPLLTAHGSMAVPMTWDTHISLLEKMCARFSLLTQN